MRVVVLGASGAVGRPLVSQLVRAGHEVVGTTRTPAKEGLLRELGAEPVVCEAFDLERVRSVIAEARPEAVVNELTDLSQPLNPRKYKQWVEKTNRLREDVGPVIAAAASEAGARRLVSQSISFIYEPSGGWVKTEADPVVSEGPMGAAAAPTQAIERATLEQEGVDGVVLRYGYFYGPGTLYAPDGEMAALARKRQLPIVGGGDGLFSYIHVDDAASATVAAVEGSATGVFNVVDDEPAAQKEWVPAYCEALGAKPPRKVPAWLARLVAGRLVSDGATIQRGASNEKARRELGWEPRWPSWRQGFREALG